MALALLLAACFLTLLVLLSLGLVKCECKSQACVHRCSPPPQDLQPQGLIHTHRGG